ARDATTIITATPIRNSNTLRAPRSSRSNSTPLLCSCCISSLMRGFQNLVSKYVVRGHEWHRSKVAEKIPQPQSAHRKRHYHVRPSNTQGLREIGLDYPEQIHIAHQ